MPPRVMTPAYPVETSRLLLRPIDPSGDIEALHAYQSLPEVCRYIPYEPRTREDVAQRLADPGKVRSTLTEPGQAVNLAVEIKATGLVVGDVMLFWRDESNAEIGYVIHPDHQGKGIATEASAALLGLAFAEHGLGVHRVVARIDQRNPASAAVLTKLGMRQEAILVENEWFKGEWSTEVDFAILDREWHSAVSPTT
ncbi:MAG TPA: GNAT family N-acetyltransferase [Trebonia sp.]